MIATCPTHDTSRAGEYLMLPPPYFLQEYVRYFWVLENVGHELLPKTFGPLADGCPGIIFQLSEEGSLHDQNGELLTGNFLYGQTTKFTRLNLTGKYKLLGVCFFPNTLKSIFSFSANELTNSCLDLELLSLKEAAELADQLRNTFSVQVQIQLISAFLLSFINKNNIEPDQLTAYVSSKIIRTKGSASLKELQKSLKLSERSFERKFGQHVGISPKVFSTICRFQAALSQLKNNNYTKLSDIAFDNGYADQPHFIRAFKGFTGYSPHQFKKQSYKVIRISLY